MISGKKTQLSISGRRSASKLELLIAKVVCRIRDGLKGVVLMNTNAQRLYEEARFF